MWHLCLHPPPCVTECQAQRILLGGGMTMLVEEDAILLIRSIHDKSAAKKYV